MYLVILVNSIKHETKKHQQQCHQRASAISFDITGISICHLLWHLGELSRGLIVSSRKGAKVTNVSDEILGILLPRFQHQSKHPTVTSVG